MYLDVGAKTTLTAFSGLSKKCETGPVSDGPQIQPPTEAPAPEHDHAHDDRQRDEQFKVLFGWTFFDPANLISLLALTAAAVLVVTAMQGRGARDWYMAIGLYLCFLIGLRGYIFSYYHGRVVGRAVVLGLLEFGLLGAGLLWEDRARSFELIRGSEVVTVPRAEGFHVAAVLHVVVAATLGLHAFIPRTWVIKATDPIADRAGRDAAIDAPPESVGTGEEGA
jgi:hypothetical protein